MSVGTAGGAPHAPAARSVRWRPFALATLALAVPAALLAWFFLYGPGHALYEGAVTWILTEQQRQHGQLREALSGFADGASWEAGWSIVLLSFLYGIFHAAGPGHGKVILSTYLLTQPERIGRSLWLAVASAMAQAVTAIVLVYGLFWVFGIAARQSGVAVQWSERLAYALVLAIGIALVWRGWKAMRAALQPAHVHAVSGHDHHHHDHGHHDHGHHHHHAGEVCSTCGHAHAPSAEQVEAAGDWRTALGIILSVGLRPCTGAILVLVFARFAGISWIGVTATFAMAVGTAITVSAIAFFSVKARDLALRFVAAGTSGVTPYASALIALSGGVVIILIGVGLLEASLDTAPARRSMGL